MTRHVLLALACLLVAGLLHAQGPESLAAAQKLYAAAQYEDALKLLDGLKAGGDLAPEMALRIEQSRVFCLLVLDRLADAEQAVQAILDVDPSYQPGEDDAAPKLRAAVREIRRRALPAVLQRLYARSKQAYDRKSYAEAASGFTRVLALLDDPDLALEASARSDMRLIAQAFLDLSGAAGAPAPAPSPVQPATPPAPPVADAPPASGPPAPKAAPPVYDAASTGVTPPSARLTGVQIPNAMRPTDADKEAVVEVVIGVDGAIEAATIRQSAGGVYDALIVRSALAWRYRPATQNGTPVRYRLLVRVVLSRRG